MNKSRILSVALTASLVASFAAASAIGASAAGITKTSDIKSHSVGLIGSFNGWDADLAMSDEDGDGVFEGTIAIDSVTEDQLQKDDNGFVKDADGNTVIQFKVRLDAQWTDSWGAYEPDYDRTWNSQTNCSVAATAGEPITINVKFDTTSLDAAALADSNSAASECVDDETQNWGWLAVTYEVAETEKPAEESTEESTETSVEESKEEAEASTETSDVTPVQTGDTTSAIALAAVVVASLGTAVVMTKKASSKN